MKKNRGFTILELMIVMTILGILLSLYAPNTPKARKKALDTALKIKISHLRLAVESYSAVNKGKYPSTLNALVPEYLSQYSSNWKGANDFGEFIYNNDTGIIILADRSGISSQETDYSGVKYAEY